MTQPPLPDSVPPAEVVRCLACRRPLTDPASKLRRKGSHCADEEPLTPRGFNVDQDALPGLGGDVGPIPDVHAPPLL